MALRSRFIQFLENICKWLAAILLLISLQVQAQILTPVKWTYSAKEVSKNTYELILKATIDKEWHVYSQHLGKEGTNGSPVPTSFQFKKNDGYSLVSDVIEKSNAEKVHDPNFDMDVVYFENQAVFIQKVKLNKPMTSIEGSLEFMVCNNRQCLAPETKEFSISLEKGTKETETGDSKKPEVENEPSIKAAESQNEGNVIPNVKDAVKWNYSIKNIKDNEYEIKITANIGKGWHLNSQNESWKNLGKAVEVSFSEGDSARTISPITTKTSTINVKTADGSYAAWDGKVEFLQKIEVLKKGKTINGQVSFTVCTDKECSLPQHAEFTLEVPHEKVLVSHGDQPLSAVFWLGFFGGLAALLTPCVFPMIPLTVSFFTKQSEKKSKGVSSALIFGASIMFIYVGLGLLITVLFGPNALNDLASNVYTNLAFFLIFSVFAFSFLGAFDITLPSSWANKTDERAEKGGVIGIFFIALTLTIVSFSCTSLVIGNLLIFAAKGGGYTGPTVGMLGFSLAWAIPFTIFAMFPSLMQKLPKSGGWLNAVKVTLGFIELALALKFLSTADLTYHWGFLKREYFLALWIIIFGMLGFYLLGKLRLSHDSPATHISVTRLMIALIALSFTLYMIPGLWGAPVKLLSGIAPPSSYSEWNHNNENAQPASANTNTTSNKPHKYHELFDCPHGLDCYFDYDEALEVARETKKPLMLDFTGHSCSNCRKMEDNVWSDNEVLPKLKNDYILVSLYVDDKTPLAANEVYVSKYNGNTIKTLGEKWKDMQASKYGANSQPFYVLLDNNEGIIGEYGNYDPDVAKFLTFLNDGQSKFKKVAINN